MKPGLQQLGTDTEKSGGRGRSRSASYRHCRKRLCSPPKSASDRLRAHGAETHRPLERALSCALRTAKARDQLPVLRIRLPLSGGGVLLLIFRLAARRPSSPFASVSARRSPPGAAWKHLVRGWIFLPACPRDAGPTVTPSPHPRSSSPGPTPLQPPPNHLPSAHGAQSTRFISLLW